MLDTLPSTINKQQDKMSRQGNWCPLVIDKKEIGHEAQQLSETNKLRGKKEK